MISEFLNKRYSTRKLSDSDFENIVEQLAEELVHIDYKISYSEEKLKKDWLGLKNFSSKHNDTSSTTRIGMSLCEHFFPNFFNIKNARGISFSSSWNKENLIKVLRWNRKCHSTPYLSEIKRGIYFCTGLTKNTMFRPHLAKTIISAFDGDTVLDPCAGWGGRLLGTVAAGKKYIGFETNKQTYNNLNNLIEFLDIKDKAKIFNIGSEHMNDVLENNIDVILTSPPYFNLEVYSDSKTQSENRYSSYEAWRDLWLSNVVKLSINRLNANGVSCWNVHNVGKMKMIEDVESIHKSMGYEKIKTFSLLSSKRQAIQNETKNLKNSDMTICYRKQDL